MNTSAASMTRTKVPPPKVTVSAPAGGAPAIHRYWPPRPSPSLRRPCKVIVLTVFGIGAACASLRVRRVSPAPLESWLWIAASCAPRSRLSRGGDALTDGGRDGILQRVVRDVVEVQ